MKEPGGRSESALTWLLRPGPRFIHSPRHLHPSFWPLFVIVEGEVGLPNAESVHFHLCGVLDWNRLDLLRRYLQGSKACQRAVKSNTSLSTALLDEIQSGVPRYYDLRNVTGVFARVVQRCCLSDNIDETTRSSSSLHLTPTISLRNQLQGTCIITQNNKVASSLARIRNLARSLVVSIR